jgi:hypothetical protein
MLFGLNEKNPKESTTVSRIFWAPLPFGKTAYTIVSWLSCDEVSLAGSVPEKA